jgi:acyl dehydratase
MSPVRTTTRLFDDVGVGDVVDELDIPLTRTVIVATAMASRDYQDVHHDPELAHERGSEDIFMNILTTNGFVGRYVTDWAGPGAIIKKVSIRLGAPNYPGDTMRFTGEVLRTTSSDGAQGADTARGDVELKVRGANSRGDHVTGTVVLSLPRRSPGADTSEGSRP